MSQGDNTPVIIGVGQYSERVGEPGYEALSPMDLAGRALKAAIRDCEASGDVADAIETLAAIRQFEIARPDRAPPFGGPDNRPLAIARRVGASPDRLILTTSGGQTNQQLVGEFAEQIARGEIECAAIVGAEAISTTLALIAKGEKPDWNEELGGEFEDQGYGVEDLIEPSLIAHGAIGAIPNYALFENARRAALGLELDEYRLEIGRLFAPFTKVAAANPHAASREVLSAEELATVTKRNRIVAEPYPRLTVARDQVNQAAAILIASRGRALELGIAQDRLVHIHGVAASSELKVMERPDLARSPASIASLERALDIAGVSIDAIAYLDFYSCFAIPVFNAIDHFGLAVDDRRGLTLTGGLPFFGGAGNNYSAHAIAEAVARVRRDPGSFALVGANGGWMSKYATGIYSTLEADWSGEARYQVLEKSPARVPLAREGAGRAAVESYTITDAKLGDKAIVIARTEAGERVACNADLAHQPTRKLFEAGMPFGARLALEPAEAGRIIARVV